MKQVFTQDHKIYAMLENQPIDMFQIYVMFENQSIDMFFSVDYQRTLESIHSTKSFFCKGGMYDHTQNFYQFKK